MDLQSFKNIRKVGEHVTVEFKRCGKGMTDALFRRTDPDRYDDRDIVQTNLVESVDRLMAFGTKHLPDPFFLDEKAVRISIRDIIVREMVVNMLIHREFLSPHRSRFVIEPDRMYTENPSRASRQECITPTNLEPDPKNPIVAAFFRTIGFADELGSGVRKMFKYGRSFAGTDPDLTEGDTFRCSLTFHSPLFDVNLESRPELRPESQPESQPESNELAARIIRILKGKEKSKSEIVRDLGQKAVSGQLKIVLSALLSKGTIERTIPTKPNSRLQKYRLKP